MIKIRRANERGHANHGWLNAYHTFSFGSYFSKNHMSFRDLRVINEDRIAPNNGFGSHPHEDMEIITYVISGELKHEDSLGNGEIIKAGEFQVISAGSGITHSEFNPSSNKETHLYQIWILPEKKGINPSYNQKIFVEDNDSNLTLIASNNGDKGSFKINQDVRLYHSKMLKGKTLKIPLDKSRYGWIQLVKGELSIEDQIAKAGDGVMISEVSGVNLEAIEDLEVLFFDLK